MTADLYRDHPEHPDNRPDTKLCDCCGKEKRNTRDYFRRIFDPDTPFTRLTDTCIICLVRNEEAENKDENNKRRVTRNDAREAKALEKSRAVSRVRERENRRKERKKRMAEEQEYALRVLSRRKLVQFIKTFHRNYEAGWVHHDICRRLEKFAKDIELGRSPRLMLFMPPRHGKLLAHDTEVLTPSGWRRHGELREGDVVFHPSGSPVRIVAVSAEDEARVEVELTNGEVIQCHENHEWTIYDRTDKSWKTVETRWFTATTKFGETRKLHTGPTGRRGGRYKFQLPETQTACFPDAELPPRRRIAIKDVRPAKVVKTGRCIQVDSPDGLYLVGRSLVPTHNSEIASNYFPSWLLGHYPHFEIIAASYAVSLPIGFSRKVRARLQDPMYRAIFPKATLNSDSKSAEAWLTTQAGGYVAAGVGGGITGKGAHCAYFQVKCTTRRGLIPIDQVKVGDYVKGFSHGRQESEWTLVRAVSTQYKRELIDIEGALLTPDHPVWTEERGYVPAAEAEGSHVRVSQVRGSVHQECERVQAKPEEIRAERENILFEGVCQPSKEESGLQVREREGVSRQDVQVMLPARQTRKRGLLSLWKTVQTYYLRTREKYTQAWRGHKNVLQPGVLRPVPAGASTGAGSICAMPDVRGGYHIQSEPKVLQQRVLPGSQGEELGIRRYLEQAETGGCEVKRARVRELWEREGSDGDTSHRPRCSEPQYVEPDPDVRAVPQPLSSQVHGICAADLADALPKVGGYRVVDLQTDTQNFFADGLLVHNCLIIDDPVKDSEEADSETIREKVWDWYGSTAYTRLAPGGGVLVIQTRWHDGDLSGLLIEQMNALRKEGVPEEEIDNWEIIEYPAIATRDEWLNKDGTITEEPLHKNSYRLRSEGEPLHPARFPLDRLKRIKRSLQPRHWSALYQQNPVPDEGVYFTKTMFRYIDTPPPLNTLKVFVAFDLAIGEKQQNDYTVGAVGGLDCNDQIFVLDVIRFKGDAFKIVEAMLDAYKKYDPVLIGIEKGQLEHAIKPQLKKRMRERRLYPTLAEGKKALVPVTDKMERARPLQGRMQQGMVYFNSSQPWMEDVRHELLRFPGGVHDDIVDALAWLVRMMIAEEPPRAPKSKQHKSWKDKLNGYVSGGRGMTHMEA